MKHSFIKFVARTAFTAVAILLLALPSAAAGDNAGLWRFGFSLSGQYSLPGGGQYQGREPGLGFGAEILFAVSHRFALRGAFSKSGLKAEEDLVHPTLIGPDEYLMFGNYQFSSMRYFVAFEYYHQKDRQMSGGTIYHLYFGPGVVTHKTDLDEVHVDGGVEISRVAVTIDETRFALNLGGGLTYMLGPVVGLYAGANIAVLWPKDETEHDEYWDLPASDGSQYDLKLGLTVFIE